MKTIYNADSVVYVRIKDKELDYRWEYKPYKKSFWSGVEEEGWYDIFNSHYTKEELESGEYHGVRFIVNETSVYFRPNVTVKFFDGSCVNKVFDTYEEALVYGNMRAAFCMTKILTL